jgi:CDP-diacylglycerol--glycerol-3-phosphate 3-phosphatidyltransferase
LAQPSLSKRRLLGIDRSGGPADATVRGQPLHPWTLPNAVGFVRLALVPVFLVLALRSGDGRVGSASAIYAVVCGSDYLDGLIARATGQYSRLGALLDPLVDRLVVVAGAVVAWHFELLPRWALALLAARELVMLALTQAGLRRGVDLEINWIGRWAVWPTMFAIWLSMVSVTPIAEGFLYVGLALTLAATALYVSDGLRKLRRRPSSSA